MAVKIRLARGGAKKRPFYHLVAADIRAPRDGKYIERLGFFNPMVAKDAEDRTRLNIERIQYWLGQGAKPTLRVHKLLAEAGLMEKPAVPTNQTKQHLPKAKAQERLAEKEEKAKAAAEAVAEAEAKPAEEAAVEEALETEATETAIEEIELEKE